MNSHFHSMLGKQLIATHTHTHKRIIKKINSLSLTSKEFINSRKTHAFFNIVRGSKVDLWSFALILFW